MATLVKKPKPRKPKKPLKQSTPALSSLASDILTGRIWATQADARRLAASVLGQDEAAGQAKPKRRQ